MPCRSLVGESPGPHPGGKLKGLARGGRGSPGPHLGRGVSQHALRQTLPPPPWTATAVGGKHPTGMQSCFSNILVMPPSIS